MPENGHPFATWLDDFLAAYYERRPVDATFIGMHEHDHRLPDYSPEGRRASVAAMRSLLDTLASIPTEGLTEAQRHDRRFAAGQLDLELWEDGAPQFYRGNPAVYTGEGVFSIISLFLRDAEPFGERVAAAISRMTALPGWLAQGRANVRFAPQAWTERARREAAAAVAYFERGLPLLARERKIADRAFTEAVAVAGNAFAEHLGWLDDELAENTGEAVGCGEEAFNRYLRSGHCLPEWQDAVWVEQRGRAALSAARAALERLAESISPGRTWQEVLTRVPDDHPEIDEYLETFGRTWVEARDAAVSAGLITWPEAPIAYTPIPESDREAAADLYYLPYRCPAPFGRAAIHRYLVTPVERGMTEAERRRRLRAANHPTIKLNHVVHHGGLGHHVQNWHAFRAASRIGRVAGVDGASRLAMFCAGTLVEGWACYATDLMEEIGALSPIESIVQAHGRLRMAARAVADAAFHLGKWTLEETTAFYEREAGMSAQTAKAEAVKNSLFPGAAMMYLIGTDAIHDLREQVRSREGESFNLRSFHDGLLSYGAIPVVLIRDAMLG